VINEILSNYDDDFIQLKKDVFPITDYNSTDFNTESLKKTICSFLNYSGGTILIGIDEDDHTIKGILLTHK